MGSFVEGWRIAVEEVFVNIGCAVQASAAAPVGAAVTSAAAAHAAAGGHGRFAASVADIPKPQVAP
jgi:hypothetical protein